MIKAKPTKKQLEYLDWEIGVFFHFGIRTFYQNNEDWDEKPMDASVFNPSRLDCRQWMRIIKEAGAKYCVLTCKHHDGFAVTVRILCRAGRQFAFEYRSRHRRSAPRKGQP